MTTLTTAPDYVRQAFEAFRRRIHAQCPDSLSIDLAGPQEAKARGICGEHGRVVPTRHKACPKCAGHIEAVEGKAAK